MYVIGWASSAEVAGSLSSPRPQATSIGKRIRTFHRRNLEFPSTPHLPESPKARQGQLQEKRTKAQPDHGHVGAGFRKSEIGKVKQQD
jgi:hypothetical protein